MAGIDWLEHFTEVSKAPPRETLRKAVKLFERESNSREERYAIDLGCGTGRDALELLRNGWRVLAIDGEAEALEGLLDRVPQAWRPRLEARQARFEGLELPDADLVNASYSLPFCAPEQFNGLWQQVVASIQSGGRFAGHLCGVEDDLCSKRGMTSHTAEGVHELLADLEIEYFREIKGYERKGPEELTHLHAFALVARAA
jgi:SAM-dependent methyltransferase